MNVAIEVTSWCQNLSPLILSYGAKDDRSRAMLTYPYPLGQQIRGVIGYLLLEMESPLADSLKNRHPTLYFKDCFPQHGKDQGLLYPLIQGKFINYRCEKCGEILRYATFIDVLNRVRIDRGTGSVAQMFRLEGITHSHKFRFKIIYCLKEAADQLGDFLGLLDFLQEFGLHIGKGGMKGAGKLVFEKFQKQVITLEELQRRAETLAQKPRLRLQLLADAIIPNGTRDILDAETFVSMVKKAGKFFNPEYQSYEDPAVRLIQSQTLPPEQVSFLDTDKYLTEYAIPPGTLFTYEIPKAPPEFYLNLAIAERCMGISRRTAFGKGEFILS